MTVALHERRINHIQKGGFGNFVRVWTPVHVVRKKLARVPTSVRIDGWVVLIAPLVPFGMNERPDAPPTFHTDAVEVAVHQSLIAALKLSAKSLKAKYLSVKYLSIGPRDPRGVQADSSDGLGLDPISGSVACRASSSGLLVIALACCCLATTLTGCHRQFYRKQADQEVNQLISEKASHVARPPVGRLNIEVDPRSRMFNPFDLDFQPIPVDDPASNRYMQCVDGKRGYPLWNAAGVTNAAESPDWWQYLPLDEDGVLVLNADSTVELAFLHSPEYQRQLEQLYLSALDVSSERFLFDTQFFGDVASALDVDGPDVGDSTRATLSDGLSMTRRFATGSQMVVELANSIVWELSGPNDQYAPTSRNFLNFSFIQPLLRNAGRDRVLERLTLSERRLLSNVRAFERYRRSFYLNVTIGRGLESQVSRSGGVFGVGLQGFTGLGSGFGGIGGGGGGGGISFGAAVPQAGGFMGLLQDQLQIKFLKENIARTGESKLILENTLIELLTTIPDDPEEILRQRLQVAQLQNDLIDLERSLVSTQAAYQATIDGYLQTMGLPPYLCVRIEDPLLESFELIDERLQSRREDLIALRTAIGELNIQLLGLGEQVIDETTGLPASTLKWTPEVEQILARMEIELKPLKAFLSQLTGPDAQNVLSDITTLKETVPLRIEQSQQLQAGYQEELDCICTLMNIEKVDDSIFDTSDLPELPAELTETHNKLLKRLNSYNARIEVIDAKLQQYLNTDAGAQSDPAQLANDIRQQLVLSIQDLLAELGEDVLSMQLIQARARTETAFLPVIQISPAQAFEVARRNRRDWANARAALVDSYRLIEFNADDLESGLQLRFDGGFRNNGETPFSFNSDSGSLTASLQWDAPLTRLQERNTYRQALIEYERSKRTYYQYEDNIWRLMRGQIRQLKVNRLTFEYGRQSVKIATDQIQLNEDIRELRDSRGLASGPTAARDTSGALASLRRAQETLLNVYVNYEVVRRNLQFDLGTMELTPDNIWLDQPIDAEYFLSLPGTTVEAFPAYECNDCNLPIRRQGEPIPYGTLSDTEASLHQSPPVIEAVYEVPESEMPVEEASAVQGQAVEVPAAAEEAPAVEEAPAFEATPALAPLATDPPPAAEPSPDFEATPTRGPLNAQESATVPSP
ncbi:hypothetical protein SV7mr_41510 [Stieleria bergensis]|uniref:Outer membrane efflux protein n=2 Tax=Stieleria bergensis TaxID=2528025 RepID=A0A517SZN7_9BACT|nr:hypothetical protein SV7mr_41510 [Planctomycetes bacterium SV_7m_r]